MNFKIGVIKGDGIGPEVVDSALKILDKIGEKYGHLFRYDYALAGGCAIDKFGVALPNETLSLCKNSDSVLLGAVGGPKWDNTSANVRPEQALLGLRSGLNLYCNLRPAVVYKPLIKSSPLKENIIENGIDICVVRELTGGIYFGDRNSFCEGLEEYAWDTEKYSTSEIRRIAIKAFELAKKRRNKVTSIDKANILESSRLWRKTVEDVAKDYKGVELNHMYIDNAAMQLIRNPNEFDVILTSNMFGDILSDEASMITGSIGMLPSASLGKGNFGLYEPIHGSAPDLVGKGICNPLATILSVAMMLRYSFNLIEESNTLEKSVIKVLEKNYRTADIMSENMIWVGTDEITNLVIDAFMKDGD
ncbi:3-isopropylmalate dehydrogenase [Clostridium tarantellae]|uniref:3-isopropylmalate dehydrogenase n=1 Tax=Clostridium tarantellae TaxID=39493 RepID=A0A6I1MFN5_9CLOT|nr:3-isopropylmalate dehydrogenase [Clostridium tarantellae]MPQ42316.1 3-isopropylmalate dehydrogenase [Clostridium tarantellae]